MLPQTEIEEIYSDNDILVVNKPSGIPTAPLTGDGDELCLVNIVRKKHPQIMIPRGNLEREGGLIHRLDTPTSGLVLFALNQAAYDNLIKEQKRDGIIKQYRAVFTNRKNELPEGFPAFPYPDILSGNTIISSYFRLFGPRGAAVRPALNAGAKRCSGQKYSTQIEMESENSVICTLSRGFRHQIRCHMAWAGYPLKGDVLYGGTESEDFGLTAVGISFTSPSTGSYLTLTL